MAFKVRADIPRTTTFAYRQPPKSGNLINGLGETEPRRASHVFHNDGDEELPWDALDGRFAYVNDWRSVLLILRNIWHLRKATGREAAWPGERPGGIANTCDAGTTTWVA